MIANEARVWIADIWVVLIVVWVAGTFLTKPAMRRQSNSSRFWHLGVIALGAWLLFSRQTGFAWLDARIFVVTGAVAVAGIALAALGVAFAIWARLILGSNWSGTVTVKADHTLVRRGPYRIVRHPIYTGILLGLLGTAVTHGKVSSLLALPVCAFGFWLKSLMEERFMVEQFGEQYLQYRHQVRALVPYLF